MDPEELITEAKRTPQGDHNKEYDELKYLNRSKHIKLYIWEKFSSIRVADLNNAADLTGHFLKSWPAVYGRKLLHRHRLVKRIQRFFSRCIDKRNVILDEMNKDWKDREDRRAWRWDSVKKGDEAQRVPLWYIFRGKIVKEAHKRGMIYRLWRDRKVAFYRARRSWKELLVQNGGSFMPTYEAALSRHLDFLRFSPNGPAWSSDIDDMWLVLASSRPRWISLNEKLEAIHFLHGHGSSHAGQGGGGGATSGGAEATEDFVGTQLLSATEMRLKMEEELNKKEPSTSVTTMRLRNGRMGEDATFFTLEAPVDVTTSVANPYAGPAAKMLERERKILQKEKDPELPPISELLNLYRKPAGGTKEKSRAGRSPSPLPKTNQGRPQKKPADSITDFSQTYPAPRKAKKMESGSTRLLAAAPDVTIQLRRGPPKPTAAASLLSNRKTAHKAVPDFTRLPIQALIPRRLP